MATFRGITMGRLTNQAQSDHGILTEPAPPARAPFVGPPARRRRRRRRRL